MPEIREVVWYLGLEWSYEIGCTKLRSRLNSSAQIPTVGVEFPEQGLGPSRVEPYVPFALATFPLKEG